MGFFDRLFSGIRKLFSGEGISRGIVEEVRDIEPEPTRDQRALQRKIVKQISYKRNLFALTFERNDTDRSSELIEAVSLWAGVENVGGFGYEQNITDESPSLEYPTIETGAE